MASSAPPPEPKIDPSQPNMLKYQPYLPKLPVPPLQQTLDLYLTTLKPHLTEKEYVKSEATVRDFGASDLASKLQTRLERRAAEKESWLSEWCVSYSAQTPFERV